MGKALASDDFYENLPAFDNFAEVCQESHYRPAPGDWDLVIADVVGSTKAIESGRYHDVNAAGASSIVVVRNAMKDVGVPYVFGGDGATLLTPSSRREALFAALRGLQRGCSTAFGLEMRAGVVPVHRLQAAGAPVEVARFAASDSLSFAMLRGPGVDLGESWVKDPSRGPEFAVPSEGEVFSDFEGFECRWQPVPSRHGLVASVIIKALKDSPVENDSVYRYILEEIGRIVQNIDDGRPVALSSLSMKPLKDEFAAEARLRSGHREGPELASVQKSIRKYTRYAKFMFATGISLGGFKPKQYKRELVAHTDFRKFDNVLRMHLDLRRGQLDDLKHVLQTAEDDGYLVYGIHTADHTLMTCVIDSYQGSHAHFVDGAAGGYALAAKRIKARMRELK